MPDHTFTCAGVEYIITLAVPLSQTGRTTEPSFDLTCNEREGPMSAGEIVVWIICGIFMLPTAIALLGALMYAVWLVANGFCLSVKRLLENFKAWREDMWTVVKGKVKLTMFKRRPRLEHKGAINGADTAHVNAAAAAVTVERTATRSRLLVEHHEK
ncbi:hypothetical protein EDD11_007493 [Mortierella claussenii]|nr:hypothetical protein EDD11_007493 [Mortierella claussenii]